MGCLVVHLSIAMAKPPSSVYFLGDKVALPLLPDAFPGHATAGSISIYLFVVYVAVSREHFSTPVVLIKLATLSMRVDAGFFA